MSKLLLYFFIKMLNIGYSERGIFFMNKAIWEFLMEMKKYKLTFENYELCPSLEALSVEERIVLDEYAKDFRVKSDVGNQWV